MDKDQNHMTQRILNLTLEIIYLLTGEGYTVVKKTSEQNVTSGGHQIGSHRHSTVLSSERNNDEKILEATKKMKELLTGEVPIRCQDVTVYFSMEEWEYLEGHKDLYKDVMMENQMFTYRNLGKNTLCLNEMILKHTMKILNLLIGEDCVIVMTSSLENNVTRRSHRLHKRLKERLSPITVPPLPVLSPGKINKCNILEFTTKMMELLTGEVPIRCQDVTVYFSMEEWEYLEGHKDLYKDVMMENQPPVTSPGGHDLQNTSEEHHYISADTYVEDNGFAQYSPGVNPVTRYIHHTPYSLEESMDPSNPKESSDRSPHWTPDIHLRSHRANKATDSSNLHQWSFRNEVVNTVKSSLSCLGCGKSFKLKSELLIHLRGHTKVASSYSECGTSFTEKSEPLTHQQSHADEKPFSCTECGKCFILKKNLLKHQDVHPGQHSYSSSECGKCSIQKPSFFRHERLHKCESSYSSSACGKCLSGKQSLVLHHRIHTGEQPYSCSECGKCFTAKAKLLIHHRIHTGERPISCSECGKCFNFKTQLLEHQRVHTGERPYSCSECGKGFTAKAKLLSHHRIHTGEHPFSCSECGKCFNFKTQLLEHQRVHTGERPYSCSECGKGFAVKAKLLIHHRVHTGERPFSCSECGKGFSRNTELLRHQIIHTGESPFSCPECGKCFNVKGNLLKHQRIHTGARPFPCLECGESFSWKTNLLRHQKSHTGEIPFECSECGQCFTRKLNLLRHQKKHTDERPFSCSECGKCYQRKSNLVRHQTTHTPADAIH